MHKDLASSFSPLTAGGEQAADTYRSRDACQRDSYPHNLSRSSTPRPAAPAYVCCHHGLIEWSRGALTHLLLAVEGSVFWIDEHSDL